MTHFITPLTKATTSQYENILKARNRLGAHAFYTGGFKAEKRGLKVYLPSTFGLRFALTVVFEYHGKEGHTSFMVLAHETRPTETCLRLSFSDIYDLEYYRDGEKRLARLKDLTSPIKGLHVLEYETAASRLVVHLDGELVFPPENVYAETDLMRIFQTEPIEYSNFIVWESHFTATEYFVTFQPTFAFKHEALSIRTGGYALIRGKWPKNIDIQLHMKLGNIFLMKKIRSTGDTSLLMKVYSAGFAIAHANASTGPVLDTAMTNIPLDEFHVEPMPDNIFEFTVVTGEIP